MARFLWICLGGAAGTGCRYLLTGWVFRMTGQGFPYGTLAVNVLGSFLLGFILQYELTAGALPPTLRLALTTGFTGGFTTYSAFNDETIRLFQRGSWGMGAANIVATLLTCLAAGFLGVVLARWAGR